MQTVLEARDKLLGEAKDATNERLSRLHAQADGLKAALQEVQAHTQELESSLAARRLAETVSAMSSLEKAVAGGGTPLPLHPVVEDNLQYAGPSEVEKKEALCQVWGKIQKKTVAPLLRLVMSVGSQGSGQKKFYNPYQ